MNCIKKIREDKKITQMELAKRIGMSKGNLSQIESGSIGVNQENLKKIAEALNCSVAQLLGEIDIKQDIIYNIKCYSNINDFVINNEDYDFVGVSEKLLNLLKIKDYRNLIISKSDEKNMEPTISNNDFLIIDISKKEPFNNKIYIMKERNYIKVKRVLMKSPVDEVITVISDNQTDGEFPPYELSLNQAKEFIIGQVVFYGRSIL
jgi:transcriptional regulator with XRE-family HTH domain